MPPPSRVTATRSSRTRSSKRRFALEEPEEDEEAAKRKGPKVVDLMSALKRSLGEDGKRKARGARKRRAA
jgi:hypothetical protein